MSQRIFTVGLTDLGISQLYLCGEKLDAVKRWFDTAKLGEYEPLPVYDFGNGRLTLTDGHSRGFVMLCNGLRTVRVVLDRDEMITSETGRQLYKRDIEWCERKGLRNIADLSDRIIPESRYAVLWLERCKRLHNLFSGDVRNAEDTAKIFSDMYLYGADIELNVLYFERDEKYYKYENGVMTDDETFNAAYTGEMQNVGKA